MHLEPPADSVPQGSAPVAATGNVVRSQAGEAKAKAAASQSQEERKIAVGTDPNRGYIEHEAEVNRGDRFSVGNDDTAERLLNAEKKH